jgi:NCAIR mutase (PurE)-related protein
MSAKRCFSDLGFAKLDIDRKRRRGFSEVIYSSSKSKSQLKAIAQELKANKQDLLFTKLSKEKYQYLKKFFPGFKYNRLGCLGYLPYAKRLKKNSLVLVISAGTSDIPVAEEAVATLEAMGNKVKRLYDVGVAGLHRMTHNMGLISRARVIIVVAGMEGALASIVSGLVSCPVIAVPTSFGYGSSFNGLSALLTMLNSCSPGVTVVNIDNGFGAGYFASLINK